jgi:hypothetical protein
MIEQRDPQTYAIIGAAMEVHKQLGYGFLEAVYQEALAIELASRQIPFVKEPELSVTYKHRALLINFGAPSLGYKRLVFGPPG